MLKSRHSRRDVVIVAEQYLGDLKMAGWKYSTAHFLPSGVMLVFPNDGHWTVHFRRKSQPSTGEVTAQEGDSDSFRAGSGLYVLVNDRTLEATLCDDTFAVRTRGSEQPRMARPTAIRWAEKFLTRGFFGELQLQSAVFVPSVHYMGCEIAPHWIVVFEATFPISTLFDDRDDEIASPDRNKEVWVCVDDETGRATVFDRL